MTNEDNSLTLITNGEIYNYQELEAGLQQRHVFRSRSDSEVVLHLFEEKDLETFPLLDGMFAAALWDSKSQRLILARDFFGKKPLYYWHDGDRISFASELPALLGLPGAPRSVAAERLGEYLTLGFVRSPGTLIRGIQRLPPASVLVASPGRPPVVHRFAEWPAVQEMNLSSAEAGEELERLLARAVRKRLMADVPIGAFLSAGIDSSLVAALMSRASPERIRTFSLGFTDDPENSELAGAQEVSDRIHSIHSPMTVGAPPVSAVETLLQSYGEPFADSTALALYTLAAEASRYCPVVLTGDGGDELFAGYRRFEVARERTLGVGRAPMRGLASVLSGRARRALFRWSRTTTEKFIAASAVLDPDYTSAMMRGEASFEPTTLASDYDASLRSKGFVGLRGLLALNADTYLADDLLPKTDLMTMAHGVEARSPLLDRDLFRFAWNLPDRFKLGGGVGKSLMRGVARKVVGEGIASRPKQGFAVPMDRWLRGPWRELARDAFEGSSTLSEWIDADAIRALWARHDQGASLGGPLWSLLVLDRWARRLATSRTRPLDRASLST